MRKIINIVLGIVIIGLWLLGINQYNQLENLKVEHELLVSTKTELGGISVEKETTLSEQGIELSEQGEIKQGIEAEIDDLNGQITALESEIGILQEDKTAKEAEKAELEQKKAEEEKKAEKAKKKAIENSYSEPPAMTKEEIEAKWGIKIYDYSDYEPPTTEYIPPEERKGYGWIFE